VNRVHEIAAVVDDDINIRLGGTLRCTRCIFLGGSIESKYVDAARRERRDHIVLRREGLLPVKYISAPPAAYTRQRYAVFAPDGSGERPITGKG
jgi:hypothetical protein